MNFTSLTDKELLQIVMDERSTGTIAETLLDQHQTLPGVLMESSEEELISIKGLSMKKVQRLKAIQELSRRVYSRGNPGAFASGILKISAL